MAGLFVHLINGMATDSADLVFIKCDKDRLNCALSLSIDNIMLLRGLLISFRRDRNIYVQLGEYAIYSGKIDYRFHTRDKR